MSDLVIRGGTVLDGSGAPGRSADVAVTNGRISEVGARLRGRRTLDADGLVVAPGFIDGHTHYDAQVFWDPALTPSCWHGVTTVIAGNCGFTIAPCRPADRELIALTLEHVEDMPLESLRAGIPWDFETFPEYLDSVERRGTLLNFGGYVEFAIGFADPTKVRSPRQSPLARRSSRRVRAARRWWTPAHGWAATSAISA